MNVKLQKIKASEMISAFFMIKRCFLKTFFTYFDKISPVLRPFTKFRRNFCKNTTDYFWILFNGKKAGIIGCKSLEEYTEICDFAVLHKFQNKGIGKQAAYDLFKTYADVNAFKLFTIKQEERNRHFYESLGFSPTHKEIQINPRMTLTEYIKFMR